MLEVACGAGQGLGVLQRVGATLQAGDYSPEVLANARAIAADVPLQVFSAEALPFPAASIDRIVLFEALYYIDAVAFLAEARRVLRPGGVILIATANKDLYDFTPSPHATRYLGATELKAELTAAGFAIDLFGYLDTEKVSVRQRLLRPAKAVASRLGLVPRSLSGREWLKKLFFGAMVTMPRALAEMPFNYKPPLSISGDVPDRRHKVIYCCAKLL